MTDESKHELSEKRLEALKNPVLAEELETLRLMIGIFCRGNHQDREKAGGLCSECRDLYLYSRKRLACCPFGAKKPACKKCLIHCYAPEYREKSRLVMRYAGPRLIFRAPLAVIRHFARDLFRKPPEKPRGKPRQN